MQINLGRVTDKVRRVQKYDRVWPRMNCEEIVGRGC